MESEDFVSAVFNLTKNGSFYRDLWIPGSGKSRRCIGTTDRAEAERIARDLLAALLKDQHITTTGVLPLSYLWKRYKTEAPGFLDNGKALKVNDEIHADVLLAYFGDECDVTTLTENDQRAFVSKRLGGGIKVRDRETKPVRARTAEAETKLLQSMLRWATTVRIANGQRLLASNPLSGVKNVREENPLRPIATIERFTKTREAAKQLASKEGNTEAQRVQWMQLELALVIAEATGRRLGSIRQLRWHDWDFESNTVRWRAATDKKRHDAVIPVPESLINEVKAFRVRAVTDSLKQGTSVSQLLFPSAKDRNVPVTADSFSDWLEKAEKAAQLPKSKGGLWHPMRRAWATSKKHLPLSDVAQAGGWKDVGTLIRCYTQADNHTLLAVMSDTTKAPRRPFRGEVYRCFHRWFSPNG